MRTMSITSPRSKITAILAIVLLTLLVLANAPVALATDFGNTSTSGMSTFAAAGYLLLAKFTAPSSGTLNSITFFVSAPSGGNGNAAIYSDNSGAPSSLLAQGTPQAVTNGANTITSLSTSVSIAASTNYWLGYQMQSGSAFFLPSGGLGRDWKTGLACCTFPSSVAPISGSGAGSYGIYGTYSTGADFSISVAAPTSQNIGAGSTASFTLNLAATGGFSGTVNLSVSSGCPPGVTCSVAPPSVSTYPNTATLTVPTLITTSGTFNVVVSASNATVTHTATATVIVGSASTYNFNVRTGATQVVVTVFWSGTGTASVSIAGPGGTPSLSESGAVVYDRTTYVSGSSTPTNIHRVTFTLSSPPTGTWTAYVSQTGATVTIEVS